MKRPPYFLQADSDSPCDKCDKVRATCRFCEKCYECCECSPTYICVDCHKATLSCQSGSEIAQELGYCTCEPCAKCGKPTERDEGNYLPNQAAPYCDKCAKVMPEFQEVTK